MFRTLWVFVVIVGMGTGLGAQAARLPWMEVATATQTVLADLGDVNGNGHDDYAVGLRESTGFDAVEVRDGSGGVLWTKTGAPGTFFGGVALTSVSDRDNDGVRDLVVFVVHGAFPTSVPMLELWSGATGALIAGFSMGVNPAVQSMVVAVGDQTGDGLEEVVLAGGFNSNVEMLDLAIGTRRTFPLSFSSGAPLTHVQRLFPAPDGNGDGFPDLLATFPAYAQPGAGGLGAVVMVELQQGLTLWDRIGNMTNAYLGVAAAAVHDMNGDGVGDLAVSAPSSPSTSSGVLEFMDTVSGVTLFQRSAPINMTGFGRGLASWPGTTSTRLLVGTDESASLLPDMKTVAIDLEVTGPTAVVTRVYDVAEEGPPGAPAWTRVGDVNGDQVSDIAIVMDRTLNLFVEPTIAAYGVGAGPAHTLTLGATLTTGVRFAVSGGPASAPAYLFISPREANVPVPGGVALVDVAPTTSWLVVPFALNATGGNNANLVFPNGPSLGNLSIRTQVAAIDPLMPAGVALSNGLRLTF